MVTDAEVYNEYKKIVKSMLAKISVKHPGVNPQEVLDGAMQAIGKVFASIGDFSLPESFLILGFAASIASSGMLKHKGPNEVAPYVKAMAELFAYTMLDRIPSTIDQMVKQDAIAAQRAGKVKLPS